MFQVRPSCPSMHLIMPNTLLASTDKLVDIYGDTKVFDIFMLLRISPFGVTVSLFRLIFCLLVLFSYLLGLNLNCLILDHLVQMRFYCSCIVRNTGYLSAEFKVVSIWFQSWRNVCISERIRNKMGPKVVPWGMPIHLSPWRITVAQNDPLRPTN